jgi:lysophospholipase L1-like esterase
MSSAEALSGMPSGVAPASASSAPLSHVCQAFASLASRVRRQHLRILVMGDSHTRADLFTGTMRKELWGRFGCGGPGFLYAGVPQSRHDDVRMGLEGVWLTQPKSPSITLPTGDGIFGLGGVLARGRSGPLRILLTATEGVGHEPLLWDVCYRLDDGPATFSVTASGAPVRTVQSEGELHPAPLEHLVAESLAPHALTIEVDRGTPGFCGVSAERDPAKHAGVVLDALGIDGAAYATPLAWDETAWAAELRRRPPDLVVLEYGTNEATDRAGRAEVFAGHLRSLVERIRRAAPEASCLVVSPTDRSDRESKVAELHRAYGSAAAEAGCFYWDAYQWMGGRGAMDRWRRTDPPRAMPDGIHLTPAGYELMGRELASVLLRACEL